jgi:hypothetical protein
MSTKPKYNWLGIVSLAVILALLFIYLGVRSFNTSLISTDLVATLPYTIVALFSFVFCFLDLADNFADFGIKVPLANKYGWGYLAFSTVIPMILLYAYLNYLPTLGVPKIGDVWITSFVVALSFPLLIRSKFFSYTNAAGDNVSVGFDQIYDRLVAFFVRQIKISSKVKERRSALLDKWESLFSNHDDLLTEGQRAHEECNWSTEQKIKEDKIIGDILNTQNSVKKQASDLAMYILQNNGFDYLQYRMQIKASTEEAKKEVKNLAFDYTSSAVFLYSAPPVTE